MNNKECLTDCDNYGGAMADLDSLVSSALKLAQFTAMNYPKEFKGAMHAIGIEVKEKGDD